MAGTKANFLRFGNIAAFLVMLAINGLATTTLLNGRTTAQVSDLYSNLFTPAGYVFAIWGIIYALLSVFVIYQALPKQNGKSFQKQISILFLLSSIFNVVWVFLWQYNYITDSVVVMFALLVTLITIYLRLGIGKSKAPLTDKLCVQLPFRVYLGWITVAFIANVAAALVSVRWDGFGLGVETWAIMAIGLGVIVALLAISFRRDIAFGLVVAWALYGIAVKQSANADSTIVLVSQEAAIVILVAIGLSLLAWRWRRETKVSSPTNEELSTTQTKHQ